MLGSKISVMTHFVKCTAGNYRSAATYVISEQGFEIYSSTVKKIKAVGRPAVKTTRALSLSPFTRVMEKSARNAIFKEFLELLVWDF